MKRNYFENSIKYLKKLIKYNNRITEEEWDNYAKENNLFSAFTLKAKTDTNTFNELKEKAKWF